MSAGNIFWGMITGVSAGILLGVFLANEKGTVTRIKISRKSNDFADASEKKINEFIDEITQKFTDAKDETEIEAS
jgi:gas vesicle protein